MKEGYEDRLQQKDNILESTMNQVSNKENIIKTQELECEDAKKTQKQSESKIAQLMAEMFESQTNLQKCFDEIQRRDQRIKIINFQNVK